MVNCFPVRWGGSGAKTGVWSDGVVRAGALGDHRPTHNVNLRISRSFFLPYKELFEDG